MLLLLLVCVWDAVDSVLPFLAVAVPFYTAGTVGARPAFLMNGKHGGCSCVVDLLITRSTH